MDDPYFNVQWPMNSFDEINSLPISASFGDNLHHTFSHPTYELKPSMESSHTATDRPIKQLKTNSWSSSITQNSSNPQPISSPHPFANSNYANQKPKEETISSKSTFILPFDMGSQGSFGNGNYVLKASQGAKRVINTSNNRLPQAQDHIIAERKRREKLSQRFIALSALVPGLKKVLLFFLRKSFLLKECVYKCFYEHVCFEFSVFF